MIVSTTNDIAGHRIVQVPGAVEPAPQSTPGVELPVDATPSTTGIASCDSANSL